MKLYERLCKADVLGPAARLIGPGTDLEYDGTIKLEQKLDPTQPWINARVDPARICGLWTVYFTYYQFIPRACRHCWKIVWTGTTLKQLMRVYEIQTKLAKDYPAKCGVERRAPTGKLGTYQGFWYSPLDKGLAGARKLRKEILEILMREPLLAGPNVVLKRGCTEMEQRYSPSDTWDELAEKFAWDLDETLCDSLFRYKSETRTEPGVMQLHIMKGWIEYAAAHKDPTLSEYTDQAIIRKLMSYERSSHNEKDYPGFKMGEDRRESLGKAEGEGVDGGRATVGRTSGKIDTEF